MMMKTLLLAILAISAVSAGPLDDDLDFALAGLDSGADVALIQKDVADSYIEAQEFIQKGASKEKCDSVIKASEDAVKRNVAAEQTRINKKENGTKCFMEGQNQVSVARSALDTATIKLKEARKKLADAQSTEVTWKYPFSKVSESNPGMFFKAEQYLIVKAKVKKMKELVQVTSGLLTQANKTYIAALKTAKVKMLKCQCTTYTKMQLEIKTVKAAIIKSNTKAWTKAAHLSCVLSGTPLKKCTVKAMPTVTAPKLAKGVGPNACHKPDTDLLKDSCKGFRLDQQCSKGKAAFQMYSSNVWQKTRKYECPEGWHQPKAAEYFSFMQKRGCYSNRNSGDHAGYNRCGQRGYRGPDGRTRYYYTFSDSASNTRYQHAGNYVGYQSNRNGQFKSHSTVSNWAGIVCMKGRAGTWG
jgi:hypothetical protein